MTGCLCIGNIKHATLINNCYPPKKEGGTTPRSSELSYLTFYASSRPAKLTKVGSYIQKKVIKDIRKGHKNNNLVSLHILKALIQTCHRDLNIFSKQIVKILSLLLDTRDLELIDLTCETVNYHDGTTLGVDTEFTTDYEALLQNFAGFCNYTNQDNTLATKMRYTGHRATQAAVTSTALQSSDFKKQLNILFVPLIVTLASSNWETIETSNQIDIRDSALSNKINNHVIELLAVHTVSILFNKVTGPSVRLALSHLFEYMNKKEKWWPPNLAVNIMKLVLDSLQPQYRYLLVSDILYQLDLNKGDDVMNEKYACLISILDAILNANVPLVGISVLEVLNSLFTLLIKTTLHHPFLATRSEYANTIQQGLVNSMGGLASQDYYENQLNDMMGYLVSKLRPNTSLEYVDGMLLHDYRLIVLCCMDSVVLGSKQTNQDTSNCKIPLDSWNPALGLLCDKNPMTRIAFNKSLDGFLSSVNSKVKLDTEKFPKHTLKHHHDAIFMDRLVHTMQDWVLITDFNITDLRYFYAFICMLTRKFGVDATVMIVPLVFKIQQLLKDDKITQTCRQYAIESCIISFFLMMADYYQLPSLTQYMDHIKESRGFKSDDIMLSETVNHSDQPELFTIHVNDPEEKLNRVWIDRSVVVEIMSKEGNLRDAQDTHGLDLEAKLFAEWGSDAFLKHDQPMRSRILLDSNGIKPKLSSPWEHADPIRFMTMEDRKNSIRVATLKEALVSQPLVEDDGVDSDSTQSNSISANFKPPRTKADMNALLNELNLPQIQSTVSLVNPPYKSA
ncbi:hypothetical protein BDF21DRAFT_403980 [Thamnidium elegans]|nr:hypothetical protein BDF21DRAFT_403980 [Thamnidium elegans]